MIRRKVLALLGMLAMSATAAAGDPADNLRDALARLPAPQAEELQRPVVANFVDLSVLVALAAGDPRGLRGLAGRLSSPEALESTTRLQYAADTGDMQWIGADLASFRYVVGRATHGRGDTAVWRLRAADGVDALLGGLRQKHHRPVPGPIADLLTDPRSLDVLNNERLVDKSPWYSRAGASVLGGAGDLLMQGPAADDVARLRAVTPNRSLGQDQAVRTLLRGFADVSGQILQASLLSPRIGQEQEVPDLRLQPETVAGVPPYLLALIADIQDGDRPAMLIALAYADCGAAHFAGQRLAILWLAAEFPRSGKRYNAMTPADARTSIVTENRQCAAVVVIRAQSSARDTIPPFILATLSLAERDFAFLRIAGQTRK